MSSVVARGAPAPGEWEALFDELVELDSAARAARLAELAARDARLAGFLRALLDSAAAADDGLDLPLARRAPAYVAAALVEGVPVERDRSGERLGPYRLLRRIGRGGMAEVYLAERADGEFEQRVAVKRILPGLASADIHRRFLRERQILAQLEHPAIARLLDGGRGEDGDPYFVLEHVDGLPITLACAARPGHPAATVEERLRLMLAVCDAVELAHRKLVVHRDLKPSNILVTADGRVKLLDFGIAKLLADDAAPGHTRQDMQAFTPAYAAPEQILGQPVTTATDVFALGVLLFELLTGAPPFTRAQRGLPALARAVESETVERPSQAVRRLAAGEMSRHEAERRARRLEGDLDTIVARALQPDPARRYASAAALAEDLRRHLDRRPILARPDALGYRASRFLARHRLLVAAGTLVALSLVAGLGVALWQAEVARREARRAQRVRDFMVALFREADPSQTRGETITAREVLAVGARRVGHDLAGEPVVQAELLDAIAQVENGLGLPQAARGHAARAAALRLRALGAHDVATAASYVTLGEVDLALGDLAASRRDLDRAAPWIGDDRALRRRAGALRTTLLGQSGATDQAVALARQQVADAEREDGPASLAAGQARMMLAGVLVDGSHVVEGLAAGRAAVRTIERAPAATGVQKAGALRDLANMLDTGGERAEALLRFADALRLQRVILGPRHPEVALTEIPYGFSLEESHRYDEAEAVLGDAISILRPLGHFELASALRYLGFTYQARERYAEAYRCFAEAASIYAAKLGEDSPFTRNARLSEATVLGKLGRLDEAEHGLRAAAAAIEKAEGPRSNSLRSALKYLGEVRRLQGDAAEALALHRRARAIEVEIFGTTQHPGVAASDLQIVLDLLARPDRAAMSEARRLADEGIAVLRARDPEGPRLDELLVASGRVALAQADAARAHADLAEGARRLADRLGAAHPRTREARSLLAQADASPAAR